MDLGLSSVQRSPGESNVWSGLRTTVLTCTVPALPSRLFSNLSTQTTPTSPATGMPFIMQSVSFSSQLSLPGSLLQPLSWQCNCPPGPIVLLPWQSGKTSDLDRPAVSYSEINTELPSKDENKMLIHTGDHTMYSLPSTKFSCCLVILLHFLLNSISHYGFFKPFPHAFRLLRTHLFSAPTKLKEMKKSFFNLISYNYLCIQSHFLSSPYYNGKWQPLFY